jgi:uncharacterized membrane protein
MNFYRKYKWLLPMLLFTTGLILFRIGFSFSLAFLSISWNLFLAIVPLYISYRLSRTRSNMSAALYLLAWLLFFPNSMYLITDLLHLTAHPGIPKWYDLLMLFSAAVTGAIIGYQSLYQVELFLRKHISRQYIQLIIFSFFILCGYGVYLGRYLRWNSWDIIMQPLSLASDIRQQFVHPFRNIQCWLLTGLFGTWMYIIYRYFKTIRVVSRRQEMA